jgi:hypothetical protein
MKKKVGVFKTKINITDVDNFKRLMMMTTRSHSTDTPKRASKTLTDLFNFGEQHQETDYGNEELSFNLDGITLSGLEERKKSKNISSNICSVHTVRFKQFGCLSWILIRTR